MEEQKSVPAKLWKFLSGKKRTIALLYWSIGLPAISILWPEGAPAEVYKATSIVGLSLSYLGLGHAAVKNAGTVKPADKVSAGIKE